MPNTSISPPSRSKTSRDSNASVTPKSKAPRTSSDVAAAPEPEKSASFWSREGAVARIFSIDVRTLALFRIGIALILLSDLRVRAADLTAFYSDAGVLPRSAFIELYAREMPNLLSLHLLSGLPGYQALLFVVAAVFALFLLVGYQTRWFAFFSWVMLVSLHNRNPSILAGGDVVLRMLLFWGLFLPLGQVWSLDHMIRRATAHNTGQELAASPPAVSMRVLSVASFAALLQMCFVYWFSVALKTGHQWRVDGTALYYALSIDQLSKPLGRALLPYPLLLTSLTTMTMWIERWGPALILFPFWRFRSFMVVVLAGFHVCMALCLTLGLFPYVMAIGWALFLPTGFWDWLEQRLAALKPGMLKSNFECVRARLDAIQHKLNESNFGVRGPSFLEVFAPRLARAWKSILPVGSQGLAAITLLYIFVWNCRTVDFSNYERFFPTSVNWFSEATRVDQMWGMFAPFPLSDDGWYVMPAKLEDGQTVDLFRDGQTVDWSKPANLSAIYPNERWQKYTLNLWQRSFSAHRSYLAAYLTRQWNNTHPTRQRIVSMEIVYMEEDTVVPPYKSKVKKVVLWSQKS